MQSSPVARLVDMPPHHASSQNCTQHSRLRIHSLAPIQAIWNTLCQHIPHTTSPPTAPPRAVHPTVPPTLQQAQTQWNHLFQRRRTQVTPVPDGNRLIRLTTENQRVNEPWGDTLQEKPDHHMRVYVMNVNGFSLDRRGGQFDTACEVHKEVQADIMCGQEHNLDSDQTHVRSILYSTSRQHWRRSRLIFGTTPIPFTNSYKPGGTFIVSAGDVTSRMKHQGKRQMGAMG